MNMGILKRKRVVPFKFWDLRQLHGGMADEMSWRVYFEFGHADMVRKEINGSTDYSKSLCLVQKSLRDCCHRPSGVQTNGIAVCHCVSHVLLTYCVQDIYY